MTELITHLRRFNRKERFFVLQQALGSDTFHIDKCFRRRLGERLELTIPDDSYVAMDYHLDWIQLALYLAVTPSPPSPIPNEDLFRANQQDIDLLIAFKGAETTNLILVEAKLETGWTNKQLCEKADRLSCIFDTGRPGTAFVTPHFVLMSPRESSRILTDSWPEWMAPGGKPLWMELPRPEGLRKATRCNEDSGSNISGDFVCINTT